jgi:hypothetical protein
VEGLGKGRALAVDEDVDVLANPGGTILAETVAHAGPSLVQLTDQIADAGSLDLQSPWCAGKEVHERWREVNLRHVILH